MKRVLLLAAALAVGATAMPRAHAAASGRPVCISVDLKEAPFDEALRQLFSGQMLGFANYVLESEPPEGTRASVKVTRMTATEALTAVLSQYGMSYRWIGHTVWIFPQGAPSGPQRRLILYLRRNGDRTQVRLRASPYESGGEKLLWESPKDIVQSSYILPSPSFTHAAVLCCTCDDTGEGRRWLLLIPLAGGDAKKIETPGMVGALVWTEDDELDILGYEDERWCFHPSTGRLTEQPRTEEELLDAAYGAQVRTLETMLSKTKPPVAFPTDRVGWPLCEAVHNELNRMVNQWTPTQAAVSPDGRYVALVGAEAAVYVMDAATGAVRQRIPATRLVHTEGVAVGYLHWSQDSTRLLFTESHFHAARFHGIGGPAGSMPSVTDWTELVREYSLATDRTETLTVGYDAYLVPAETADKLLAGSNPRYWRLEGDRSGWGRTVRGDSE